MNMKRVKKLLLVGALALSVVLGTVGCGGNNSEEVSADSESGTTEGAVVEKIALVLPGVITDESWNTLAYNALVDYEEQGYEVAYSESVPVSDVETILRTYADQGFDLIFAHGGQFADAAVTVGADYPDTYFFVTNKCPDELEPTTNVGFFYGKEYEAAYLSGVAAASMSESGVIGYVGGIEQPSQTADKYGYINGAKSINPDIEVIAIMAGTFDDSALGKESAQAIIEQGADVIMHTCDTTGLGVIEACKDAGIYIVGYGSDQLELAPDLVITSCITDTKVVMTSQAAKIDEGSFGSDGVNWEPGIAEGVVYCGSFGEFVPSEVVDLVADVQEQIVSGELVVEQIEQEP